MFGFHPANLAFRLVLELSALVSIGLSAYQLADGFFGWVLAIGLPITAAVIWGVFNVPGDRSRSGEAPVPVPGALRLLVEAVFFVSATVLLATVSTTAALVFGVAIVMHYSLSLDRLRWLLEN